jgi:hypothetical protein
MKQLFRLVAVFVSLSAFLAPVARSGDLSNLSALSQAEFRTVSEDLGAAFSYKPLAPSSALGVSGFDISLAVTGTDISKSSGALSRAGASSSNMDTLLVPKLYLAKGLPGGWDIAGFVSNMSAINASLVGGEVRYAIVDGGLASPAVAIRGAVTSLNGVSQLSMTTRSVDISVSKGFAIFTPYAGLGQVWVNSNPNVAGLSNESFTQGKVFAGANVNFGLLNVAFEGDKTGNTTSWGLKMGLRW